MQQEIEFQLKYQLNLLWKDNPLGYNAAPQGVLLELKKQNKTHTHTKHEVKENV